MRRGLKKKMKITQYPWQKPSNIDMDQLYVDVTLEKLYRKACGLERKVLRDYRELFNFNMRNEAERILLKADPGMGKTTLGKKITHDWIEGHFTDVSIVIFVMLKSVKPGEAIEDVIVSQVPTLRGNNVTPDKIGRIFQRFGPRCLIVLDGLDEHALGQNKDVVSIIDGSKYPDCKVIVTSRPHSTRNIEDNFDSIGRVEGFTKNEARKFVERTVDDQNVVGRIVNFNPSSSNDMPRLHKVPILLSIMCFLVKSDKDVVDLMESSRGWLYFRMVRCLYMAHTKKRGISFEHFEFVRVVRSVGKLAWQTLLSGNPMFRKEEVIRETGAEVFEWGLLIGDEDPDGLSDETADILVTFAHRSIQEFFGAFYFILSISEGKTIVNLLGGDCEKPIFMVNPLFLEFCLFFLQKTDQNSSLLKIENKEKVRKMLIDCVVDKIDQEIFRLRLILDKFPALGIENQTKLSVLGLNNGMSIDIVKDVLPQCLKIQHLLFTTNHPLEKLLSALNPRLVIKTLTHYRITRT